MLAFSCRIDTGLVASVADYGPACAIAGRVPCLRFATDLCIDWTGGVAGGRIFPPKEAFLALSSEVDTGLEQKLGTRFFLCVIHITAPRFEDSSGHAGFHRQQ